MVTSDQKINILMFSMSSYFEWQNGIVNRNRQICRALLRNEKIGKILMIDYLPYNIKRSLREYLYAKIYQKDRNVVLKGLTYKVSKQEENFFVYSGINDNHINTVLEKLEFSPDLVWSYDPMTVSWLNEYKGFKVFDAVDNWAEHPVYKNGKTQLLNNYELIEEKADLIFTVSEKLTDMFKKNSNTFWVPNGVDLEHYQKQGIMVENYEITNIPKPIIGYVGVIQERFDIELAVFLAQKNPKKSFVYIGPLWVDIKDELLEKLGTFPNVYALGSKSYNIVPKYIQDFDIAIVPHHVNELTASMNPMKIYEYLACGKKVITTHIAGTEVFGDLVSIAETREEFNDKLNNLLQNFEDDARKRVDFVKEHTWKKRVDKMMGYITERLV